jgi:hypothetical protein
MIQLCLAEKGKASIQRYFPVQNREYGITIIPGCETRFCTGNAILKKRSVKLHYLQV